MIMTLEQAMSLLRTLLKIGGGVLVAHGIGTETDWTTIGGGILAIAPVVWDMYIHSDSGKLAAVAAMPEVHKIIVTDPDLASEGPKVTTLK